MFVVARDDERGSAFCIDPCGPGDGEKEERARAIGGGLNEFLLDDTCAFLHGRQ